MADDDTKVLEEAKKLPLSERVAHANWKARSAAYEDIKAGCDRMFSDSDPLLDQYVPVFSKAVGDSNANALDKALDALVSFLSKCNEQHASRICEKTCSNMVSKCLGSRPSTVQRAIDAFLGFVELEQADKVVPALLEAFSHKVPKVVVAALDVCIKIVSEFGARVVPPQPILKALPPLFDSKDNNARQRVKTLLTEIANWVGGELIASMLYDKMRDAMKDDIKKMVEEVAGTRPVAHRFTRKEQAKRAAQQQSNGVADHDDGKPSAKAAAVEEYQDPEIDAYEFAEPKDILCELKKDFWEGLESKKWTDRKAALTSLRELASYPRLKPGDYGDVNRELKKIITKDSNVAVVAEAIACTGALAKGLRKEYAGTAKSICSTLMDKYKEKNSAVGKAVTDSLTQMHKHCFNLLDVAEDLPPALAHTNPKVREDSIRWLTDVISRESKPIMTKLAPTLLPAVVKCAEDASPSLRELGMSFLVAFALKAGSMSMLEKHIAKMDDARKKKLEELVMAAAGGAPRPVAAAPSSPRVSARPASAAAAAADDSRAGPGPSSSRAASARAPSAAATKAPAKPGTKAAAGTSAAADADDEPTLLSGALTKEDAAAKLTELFGEATVAALKDAQWKARQEAMESIVSKAPELKAHASVLVQAMAHLPGWDEKNFQVMSKQFELIRIMAADAPTFTKRDGSVAIGGLLDKIADVKLRGPAAEALMAMCEAVGPQFVFTHMHKKAAPHKNPKVLSETIAWMAQAISEFGLAPMNVKALLDWMKEDLGSANAGVRNAATNLLGIMHSFIGPPLGDMLRNDVKPALMNSIEQEFAKNPLDRSFAPSRTSRADVKPAKAGKAGGGKAGKGGDDDAPAAAAFDPDELLPRADVSEQLGAKLIADLNSSNWKERKAGLDEVESVLASAGNRILPTVSSDFWAALGRRMADTNKNLAAQAVQVLGKLATAMGKPIDRQARQLLEPALKNLSDQKPYVRSAIVEMMEAWAAVAPLEPLLSDLQTYIASPKANADGKHDALVFLAGLPPQSKGAECVATMVKMAAVGVQDKTAEAREGANKLFTAMIEAWGNEVGHAAHGLDAKLKAAALEAITKITGSSVAAPAQRSAPASAPATRASTTVRASSTTAAAKPSSARPSTRESIAAAPSTSKAAAAPADDGPLVIGDDKKEERARKGKFKPSSFKVQPDELETLTADLSPLVAPHLRTLLFSKDFKHHCQAADLLRDALGSCYENILSCMDLIFRWCVLRIIEANTASLVRVLELLQAILDAMAEHGDRMTDYEAKLLLPCLVEKCGHNQDRIRADYRGMMKKCGTTVYSPTKLFPFIKDGLESKNNRTRVECADEVGCIMNHAGPRAYMPPKNLEAVQAVAKLVSERDTALRKAALSTMEVLYCFEGDGMWKLVGRLTDQQKSLIEERLKYMDKELGKKQLKPGYRKAEMAGDDDDAESVGSLAQSQVSILQQQPAETLQANGSVPLFTAPSVALLAATGESVALQQAARSSRPASGVSTAPVASTVAAAATPVGPAPGSRPAGVNVSSGSSPSALLLNSMSNEDMQQEFMRCLRTLSSSNMDEVVEAMKMLCYQLMELSRLGQNVYQLFMTHVDELVHHLAQKTDMIFSQASLAIATGQAPNSRACKYCLNTLMNIFSIPEMAKKVGDTVLESAMNALLLRLVDDRLPSLPEGDALLKALNVLMLKILENTDRTASFVALLKLVQKTPLLRPGASAEEQEKADAHWSGLTVKCLIKNTKTLPSVLNTMDLRRLLLAIHGFFDALGAEEIRARSVRDDKPLRMTKTILHELCKLLGPSIYQYTDAIPTNGLTQPVIFPYIDLNLQTLSKVAGTSNGSAAGYAAPPPAPAPAEAPTGMSSVRSSMSDAAPYTNGHHPPPAPAPVPAVVASAMQAPRSQAVQAAAADRNHLSAIFQKIAHKKNDEALLELHEFLSSHPEVDISQYLSAASDNFRNFIHKGLARVRAGLAAMPAPLPAVNGDDAGSGRVATANLSELRDRMNRIQGDLQANPLRASQDRGSLQDLQERMRRLRPQDGPTA